METLSSINKIIGHTFNFHFGENAVYRLYFIDDTHLKVTVIKDFNYPGGTLNYFTIQITEIRQNVFMITWTEEDTKNTVTHVDDFENKIAYTNITDIKSKTFYNLQGTIEPLD
ncbi:MAG: MoaF-related domain-containing protein [Ginsengibacter sp.]